MFYAAIYIQVETAFTLMNYRRRWNKKWKNVILQDEKENTEKYHIILCLS